jgi:hypothetical protein
MNTLETTTEPGIAPVKSWLWPDRAIGKVGSRQLREEHNAVVNSHDALLEALKAAIERMEAVAEGIPVENRAEGVSQATHVRHMAGHLAQHAKIARAAIRKATP